MIEVESEAQYFTDTNACSCPDFQYRGRERPCKHIRAYREALEIVATVERKWERRRADGRTYLP